jgi:ribosomal protein L32
MRERIASPKYVECPSCGKQDLLEIGGGIIRRFDTRLVDPLYKRALKGGFHTWTCRACGRKFIRSNVICDCDGKSRGIVIKSERPIPRFICSRCGEDKDRLLSALSP